MAWYPSPEPCGVSGQSVCAHICVLIHLDHSDDLDFREQFPCLSLALIDKKRMYTIHSEYLDVVESLGILPEQMAVRGGILGDKPDNLRSIVTVCCIYNHHEQKVLDEGTRKTFCELLGIKDEVVYFEVPSLDERGR